MDTSQLITIFLAALGLAFGVSTMTTALARSDDVPSLGLASFAVSFVALVLLLAWAQLPSPIVLGLGGAGLALGLIACMLLMIARHFERKSAAH